ncbi:MAG: hypothetical protein SGPRY_006783 [Prymnesium sp.]
MVRGQPGAGRSVMLSRGSARTQGAEWVGFQALPLSDHNNAVLAGSLRREQSHFDSSSARVTFSHSSEVDQEAAAWAAAALWR